jgi:Tfp pilus assembly protein PilO
MRRHKTVAVALLALAGLSAAACAFSLAYAAARGSARQARLGQRSALQQQEAELGSMRAEHDEWRRLPDDLQRFRRERLFSLDDFAAFRRELNLCLDDNGFPAPAIALQFGPARFGMRPVSLQFTLSGSYRSLKKFLSDMERKPRLQWFERVELTASGETVVGRFQMEATLGE